MCGEWEMVVKALRGVESGEEFLQSYGERPNDDFFLHYGFVPLRNPHDDVQIFENLEGALEWHFDVYPPEVRPVLVVLWGAS